MYQFHPRTQEGPVSHCLLYKGPLSLSLSLTEHTVCFQLISTMCKNMVSKKRLQSTSGNRRARRNLFGPVDRQQLHMEYQAALQKDLEEACRRWGFDFTSHKPLENSNFHWEGVPLTGVPQLYRTCKMGAGLPEGRRGSGSTATPRRGRAESSQCDKENIPQTSEKCEQKQEREENAALKRKQTNLTDFYQTKRRVVWMPCKSGE